MPDRDISLCGDDLITIACSSPAVAQQIAEHLRVDAGWLETVPGMRSVIVRFDAAVLDDATALASVRQALESFAEHDQLCDELIEVPVVYGGVDGPDFKTLCERLKIKRAEFIALHTGGEHRVDMLGFTPGFAYVGGLDARLNVPRLANPRQRVAAGSIGIAGGNTGIYALQGPGGWPLIGRTTLSLFDADAEEPFFMRPGMRIRFVDAESESA